MADFSGSTSLGAKELAGTMPPFPFLFCDHLNLLKMRSGDHSWTLPHGDADFPGRWRAIKLDGGLFRADGFDTLGRSASLEARHGRDCRHW
jgi:hypothetical protein